MLKLYLFTVLVLLAVAPLQGQTQPSAKDYFESGLAHVRRGDADGALIDIGNAIDLNPRFAEAYYLRATIRLVRRDDADGALIDIDNAIDLNPGFAEAYYLRATIRLLRKDVDGSLADFNKTLELAPTAPELEKIYTNRSVVRLLKGDTVGALSDLNKALSLNPKYAEA